MYVFIVQTDNIEPIEGHLVGKLDKGALDFRNILVIIQVFCARWTVAELAAWSGLTRDAAPESVANAIAGAVGAAGPSATASVWRRHGEFC